MNEKWYEEMKNEVRTRDVYGFEHWTPDDPEELTIVDIGANVGAFTVWAAEKFPQAKIYAFELIKENYDFCIEKVKDYLKEGEEVKARVIKIDKDERRIGLSIKAADYDEDALAKEVAAYDESGEDLTTSLGDLLDEATADSQE